MVVAGGGFEQCYNAQAIVDTEAMLVMVPQVTLRRPGSAVDWATNTPRGYEV